MCNSMSGNCQTLINSPLHEPNTSNSHGPMVGSLRKGVQRLETLHIKGIVHLNIIFSYMKFKEICNLDHSVY